MPSSLDHDARPTDVVVRPRRRTSRRRPTATKPVEVDAAIGTRPAVPVAALSTTMKFLPEGELRSDLLAGLKQGVLIAAGALVLTLPPAGLATCCATPTAAPSQSP